MSTNPETSPKASLSSNCSVWTRRWSRRGDKVRAVIGSIVIATGIGLVIWAKMLHVPSPLAMEAARLALTYETAEAGKPVVWCIDHPAADQSFVQGRATEPLAWTNEPAVPRTLSGRTGRCELMLARVVERRRDALVLEYLGRP